MGQRDDQLGVTDFTYPDGWGGGLYSFYAWIKPARSTAAKYTMLSTNRPGLLPLFFQSDVLGVTAAVNGGGPDAIRMPRVRTDADLNKVHSRGNVFNNSLKRYAIGPVFPADATRSQIMDKVQLWATDYGFTFLQPLLDGKTVDSLQPSTDLERDITTCLQSVLTALQ